MSRTKNQIEKDAAALGLTFNEYLEYVWSYNQSGVSLKSIQEREILPPARDEIDDVDWETDYDF